MNVPHEMNTRISAMHAFIPVNKLARSQKWGDCRSDFQIECVCGVSLCSPGFSRETCRGRATIMEIQAI